MASAPPTSAWNRWAISILFPGAMAAAPSRLVVGSYPVRSNGADRLQDGTPGKLRASLALVALMAIVVLAPISDWRVLREMLVMRYYTGEAYGVSQYERRFDGIRPLLPKRGEVGYLSDRMEVNEQYYLAQYTLAPLTLKLSPDRDIVVGNFFDPRVGPALARQHGLVVVRDFGKGLLLLRRGPE